MDKTPEEGPRPLAEDKQDLTRTKIRRAAMEIVARRGFDATVDDIAKASGVSPRTVFRHYSTHDELIVSTVKDMYEAFGGPLPGVPTPDEDFDGWIEGLSLAIHARNAEILGDAFWDIHAPRQNASEALAEMDAFRREYRLRGIGHLVDVAWKTAGGSGDPPEDLKLAFALNFSAFTTQALMVDFDQTPSQIGTLVADLLKMLIRSAVEAQRSN